MVSSNPFGPPQDPSGIFSTLNIRKRLLQKVDAARVDDQIFQIVQHAFEDALKEEKTVLARVEKKYLLAQVMKEVLGDMLKKLDESTKPDPQS